MSGVLIKKRNFDIGTQVQGEHHVKIKVELKVKQQKPSRIASQPPHVRIEAWSTSFTNTFRRNQFWILNFWPLAL